MTPQNTFGQPISQAGGSVVPNYTAPQTITSAHLAPQSPIQLPPPPNPTNPLPMNASVPSPIPSAASIVGQEGQTTPAETQQSSILNNIAQLMGGNTSLATLQTNQENGAGVPALTKSVNDLNTQLQGLNNQSTSLALASGAGGTIQNSNENAAVGRMSTAGLQGQEAIDLRTNQIQQAAVAAQSLTVKSALYGAQGNLTLAKDAADKAAQVQYDAQQQAIDHQKAQLAAIQPTLTKQQKVQADTVQAQLQDRQDQIAQAKQDMGIAIPWAVAAMHNYPNDAQAQYAAQQALQAAQQQPPDLQKIFGLVGKYQTDPIATQQALQSLSNSRLQAQQIKASIAKTYQDMQTTANDKSQQGLEQQYRTVLLKEVSNRSGGIGLQDQKVDQANHLMALVNQYKDPKTGAYNIPTSQYAELAIGLANLVSPSGSTAESDRQAIMAKTAKGDFNGALQYITGTPQNGNTQEMVSNLVDSIQRQGSVAQDLRDQGVTFLKGLAPTDLNQSRVDALNKNTLAPFNPGTTGKSTNTVTVQGQQFQVGTVYTDAKGNTGTFDANGKWIPQ